MANDPNRIQPMVQPGSPGKAKPAGLVALVGAVAAAVLFSTVPREESGRTVAVTIAADGAAQVKHVSGPQYLKSYLDIAGVATACDGITKGVRIGQTYTEAQCTALLEQELVIHARGVLACTPGLVGDERAYQRAAAISLGYNIGIGAFCGSSARRKFNAGDMRGGCAAMLSWNKAKVRGVLRPVAGLTARREREYRICMRGL